MALTAEQQAVQQRLRGYNGGPWGPQNPLGMGNDGHRTNLPKALADTASAIDVVLSLSDAAQSANSQAAERADEAWEARNAAVAAKDAAATSATAAQTAATAAQTALAGIAGGPVNKVNGRGGNVTLDSRDIRAVPVLTAAPMVAASGQTVLVTAAVAISLPANPTAGDWVRVMNRSALPPTVKGNGMLIEGYDDLLLDAANVAVDFVFCGLADMWRAA